jgi:hypothetical protein
LEASVTEGRSDARPREHIRDTVVTWFDGISLDDLRSSFARTITRRAQEFCGETSAAVSASDEKAGHRPYLLIVDRPEDAGPAKSRIVFSRREGAPAYRLPPVIGDYSRRLPRFNNPPKGTLIRNSFLPFEISSLQAPQHAPTATACAARTEELLDVGPACRSQRVEVKACRRISRTVADPWSFLHR